MIRDARRGVHSKMAAGERRREGFRELYGAASKECNLPPFPKVAARVMMLTRDGRAEMADIARAVGADPALSARVFRMASSTVYARREPPRSLSDAIGSVGLQALRDIVVVASARSLYALEEEASRVLWAHALATALAADELAHREGERRGEASFLAGLLHDVGKVVYHLSDCAAARDLPHFDPARERELFGVNHAVVGGLLAERWGLDVKVGEAIIEHHTRPVYRGLAGRLARADWVAHRIGYGSVQTAIEPLDVVPDDGPPLPDLEAVAVQVARTFETERRLFE